MESPDPARRWWGKRRLVYNAGLVVAGMGSLTFHAAVLELSGCRLDEENLEPMTLVYRALGYLAAMGFANLAYSLAPRWEAHLHPANVGRFRSWTFGLGFGISFVLPFTVPLLFIARC